MKSPEVHIPHDFHLPPTDPVIFSEYFPWGQIKDIPLWLISKVAMEYFEAKSRSFIAEKDYIPQNFDRTWMIRHENGDWTYAATQIKTYATTGDTESLVYLIDTRENVRIGHGELRFNLNNPSRYFKNKPFVGFTMTSPSLRRQGLGTRPLFLMNALSHMLYGYPLYSDTLIGPTAKKVWQKLVAEELATKFREGRHTRFVLHVMPDTGNRA